MQNFQAQQPYPNAPPPTPASPMPPQQIGAWVIVNNTWTWDPVAANPATGGASANDAQNWNAQPPNQVSLPLTPSPQPQYQQSVPAYLVSPQQAPPFNPPASPQPIFYQVPVQQQSVQVMPQQQYQQQYYPSAPPPSAPPLVSTDRTTFDGDFADANSGGDDSDGGAGKVENDSGTGSGSHEATPVKPKHSRSSKKSSKSKKSSSKYQPKKNYQDTSKDTDKDSDESEVERKPRKGRKETVDEGRSSRARSSSRRRERSSSRGRKESDEGKHRRERSSSRHRQKDIDYEMKSIGKYDTREQERREVE